MPLKVRISPEAAADIRDAVAYIRSQSGFRSGTRWRQGLLEVIRSLDGMPERGALVPEERLAVQGLRQLLYHSHRIIYRVKDEEVQIGRVYHSRRDRLRPEDLPPEGSPGA